MNNFMVSSYNGYRPSQTGCDYFYPQCSIPLSTLQKSLCDELAAIEGKEFTVDRWIRPAEANGSLGGGGITCIVQDGQVFEKAGEY